MESHTTTRKTYHADVVGSMLRPHYLVEAKQAHGEGKLGDADFEAVQDRAVDEALRIQEEAGVDVATDGEMRRDLFFDFFISATDGLSRQEGWIAQFRNKSSDHAMAKPMSFVVTEKLRPRSSPGLAEYRYASEQSELPVKVTLPSPTMALSFWTKEGSSDAYPDPFDLVVDAIEIVRSWIRELADAGCTYIQIDSPDLSQLFADERIRREYDERGISSKRLMSEAAEYLNEVTKLGLPGETTLGVHVCKGNGTQSWLAEGGYEDIARHVFNRAAGFDAFHLEFDDERSGSFDPLRHLPEDKMLVLGLISTKWTELEDPEMLKRRIAEASQFHPLDRLGLATQCGFASASETAEQRMLKYETQAEKLRLVAETARDLWGDA